MRRRHWPNTHQDQEVRAGKTGPIFGSNLTQTLGHLAPISRAVFRYAVGREQQRLALHRNQEQLGKPTNSLDF